VFSKHSIEKIDDKYKWTVEIFLDDSPPVMVREGECESKKAAEDEIERVTNNLMYGWDD
jgi:hypothetical protein